MSRQNRPNARDMLDRPNAWFSPSPRLFLFANHRLILPWSHFSFASFPFHTGPSPTLLVWVCAWSSTRFLGSPSIRTCSSLPCFIVIKQHSTIPRHIFPPSRWPILSQWYRAHVVPFASTRRASLSISQSKDPTIPRFPPK